MATITGKEAIELIENAAAIIINDANCAVMYPSVEQPDDEEFWNVDLKYADGEGSEYEYSFKIWGDDEIKVENNQLFLTESDGRITPILILKVQEL